MSYPPHPLPSLRPPPPPAPVAPSPRMDPLDLLSRVALGQYPLPPAPPAAPLWTSPQAPLPPHPYPARPLDALPPPAPFRPVEYVPAPPALYPAAYPSPRRDRPGPFAPDFSPVSSDDGMPPSAHHRPDPHLHGRAAKVVRTRRDADVHKARSQPSRFCHICSRTSKKVGLVACGNFTSGACRKVICQKCFTDHGWDWDQASEMGTQWLCTHCRHECPERAQCAIYKRTNERRREQQQQQKSAKGDLKLKTKESKGEESSSGSGSHRS